MNSDIDFPISNHLLLSELRLTIDSVIMFIDNASGQSDSFHVVESVKTLGHNSQMQTIKSMKFIIFSKTGSEMVGGGSSSSSSSLPKATLEAHYNLYSNVIISCSYISSKSISMNSELQTQGDLYDFLILTLCPSLCLIRSIMYMIETCKKGMDPKQVDKNLDISILNEEKTPNIIFCVKGQNAFVNIRLSKDQSHLVCFLNGNLENGVRLPSISSYDPEMSCLERAFDKTEEKNRVPHPKTSEGMRIVFGLLGIDYVLRSYEIQQQRIDSLNVADLELSDASSDDGEQHSKQRKHKEESRLLSQVG